MKTFKSPCLLITLSVFIINTIKSDLIYYLSGGVTDSSFKIKAKSGEGSQIELYLNSTFYKTFAADSDYYYDIEVLKVSPNSTHTVNLKYSGKDNVFNVRTFPSNNQSSANLNFIVSSNARTNTKSFVFDKIIKKNPQFMMMLGNLHQESKNSLDWKQYEKEYINAITLNETATLYKNVQLMYTFNDMDFEGQSGSLASSPNVNTINQVYRKMFPSYSLPANGVYQSFRYGNALFIMTDSRTFLQPSSNSFFGTTQVNWIVSQLQAAAVDPEIGAVFITLTQAWNYVSSAYDWDMIKQNYYSILDTASADKKAVGDTVRNLYNFNRPSLPGFKSVMMVIGEHTTAFDDGSWNNFGNFPIAVCGPVDYWQQCRGGPYSHGSFHDNENNFCQFNLYYDPLTSNTCVVAQGIITTDKKNRKDQVVWLYDTCQPEKFRGKVNLKCPIDYTEKLVNVAITVAATAFIFVIFFVVIYNQSVKSLGYQHLKEN